MTEQKDEIISLSMAELCKAGIALGALSAAAAVALPLENATASDVRVSSVSGEETMHPVHDETNLQNAQASGSQTAACGAKDETAGQSGALAGSENSAEAASAAADAQQAQACALKTDAGASDISTIGLMMN